MRILTIDQGTTSTRGVVFEDDRIETLHSHVHKQIYPKPGWVEHKPNEILSNIRHVVQAAGRIEAIGLTHQGESCMAWCAETKQPLSPIICWQDNRTYDHVQSLKAEGLNEESIARSGLPLEAYFSASKLAWLVRENGEVKDALKEGRLRLGTSESYFIEALTNVFVTDIGTASRTGLLNLKSSDWDPVLCEAYGVPIEALAPIDTIGGPVFQATRHQTVGCPILSLTDQPAALYGHECSKPGMMKATFGTGAFVLANVGQNYVDKTDAGLITSIAWQLGGEAPCFAVDGAVYNAASAVNWAKSIGLFSDFEALDGFDGPAAIERGLVFVPALNGLASPYWDRSASGMWWGLKLDVKPLDLARSVLEGVVLRSAQIINSLSNQLSNDKPLSIDGGLSRSRYLAQFLADATGRPVITRNSSEMTSFGCAGFVSKAYFAKELPSFKERSIASRFEPQTKKQNAWLERFSNVVERCRNHSELFDLNTGNLADE